MSFFDLDPTATQNAIDRAHLNPLNPDDLKPGWFAGAWKAPVTGLASAVTDATLLAGDAAPTALRPVARPIDQLFGTKLEDKVNQIPDYALSASQFTAPDPRTTGVIGQVVHGLFNVIPEVLAGGPETAAVLQGYKSFRFGMADGLDPGTAFGKGAIDGISTWAGLKIPLTVAPHMGALGTVATGAGGNVLTGMATRGATAKLLEERGYKDMAEQYKVLDSSAIAVDLLLGGGMGALAHYGPVGLARYQEWRADKRFNTLLTDIDTALTLNNQLHAELDTAPGIPTDPAARAAHVEALQTALKSLLEGKDVEVGNEVTTQAYSENPTATQTRQEIVRVVEEHMGDDFKALQAELEARGLPTDTTLYQISRTPEGEMAPLRTTSEVRGIIEKAKAENWGADRILSELDNLKGKLEDRNAARSEAAGGDRVRGELWVRERLMRAERNGEISPEGHRLATWLLDKNPALAEDLALSFRKAGGDDKGGQAGGYSPLERIVTIIKGRSNDETAPHEILHHAERMMPEDVQAGIQAAWKAELKAVRDWATRTQNETMMRAVSDAIRGALGDDKAFGRLAEMIAKGEVDERFYALANPSEFWAVNGSRIMRERASESWVQRAKQWLTEFIEKVKDAFGLRSDAAVIRGLDNILNSDGGFQSEDMLSGRRIPAFQVRAKPGADAPGVGVAKENLNGFEPALRVKVNTKGLELPKKPLILTGSNLKNAARQIAEIDGILAKFPDAATSPLEWSRMLAYAFGTDDVVIPPYRFIADMNSSGAVDVIKSLSKGQLADADHGFANAKEYFDLYTDGHMDVTDTGKLLLWSFLSKGVSPYVQESMFIDAFKGIDPFIKLAGEGKFTKDTLNDYYEWAATVASKGEGKPGAGTSHNLNGFGRDFLLKMNQLGEDGRTHLQRLHDLMSDPTKTGKDIRREFHTFAEGVGIDNKVLSFTLLVTGRTDVMVLDRVQFRHLWDDGRFDDGRKVDGKPVAGSKLAELGDGVRGLFIYEAIEAALQKRIENIYTAAGRPQDASVGRYHWESWVADSAQEASHGSIDAVMRQVKGEANPLSGVTAKEGQYDTRQYGARYGLDDQGVPMFRYPDSIGQEYNFDLQSFRAMLDEMQKPSSGVVGKDFKITDKRYENQPWFTRPDVNREALDALVRKFGRSGEEGSPDGRPDQAALSDGTGSGGADPYGPETVIANNPALTIVQEDGTMVSAGRALTMADAEIATAKQESQGFDAAIACALRG